MPVSRRSPRLLATVVASALGAAAFVVGVAVPAQALVPTSPDSAFWGANGRIRAVLETPTAIYLGGDFTALVSPSGATVPRTNLAALDPATGQPLSFAPAVNKIVWGLAVSPDGQTVYAGGAFTKVGTVSRGRAAAWSTTTGALLPFNPKASTTVEALAATSTTVYLGGDFTTVGTTAHGFIAATDLTGAVRTGFTATADDLVHAIQVLPDGRLLVGGLFNTIGGSGSAKHLALLDPTTGSATPFADKVPYEVFAVTSTSTQVFAAEGGAGGHTQAFSLATRRQQWLTLSDGDVHSVNVQNGVLYVGGHFQYFDGQPASHIAAVAPTTGTKLSWNVTINSNLGVFCAYSFNGHLSFGGDFTKVNRINRQHYARFSEVVDTIAPSQPGPPTAASTGTTTAKVTWGASTDDQVANVVYNVYRDGGSTPVGQVTSAATTTVEFDDSGMAPGSTHSWTVQASDGSNLSPMSAVSNSVTLDNPGYPVLTGMSMLDGDANGKVDRVELTFSSTVSCSGTCLSVWTLTSVPSNGSLQSVSVSGNTVDLNLKEGTGAADTSVGSFTVALANDPNGVVDSGGNAARFPATAPADRAGPVPTDITSTPGLVDNVMEDGDTFTATFSEPIDPTSVHAANVKEIDPVGPGNDNLIIVGLTDGAMDLGSDGYVTLDGGTIVFAESTLTLLNNNTKIRSTIVGPCSGTACGFTGAGANALVTFRPEPALTDVAGNAATGSRTETEGPY